MNNGSELLIGSMCLTDIMAAAKAGHSAFRKADNGKIYFNIKQWLNEEKDDRGNHSSVLLQSKKELQETEGKKYIGNLKRSERKPDAPVTANDIANSFGTTGGADPLDDLPF